MPMTTQFYVLQLFYLFSLLLVIIMLLAISKVQILDRLIRRVRNRLLPAEN